MTTKTSRLKTFILACATLLITSGCALKRPDSRDTADEISMKEGSPLPASLHGNWKFDSEASAARINEVASDEAQRQRWMEAYQQGLGSTMVIDAETITSFTKETPPEGQKFQAAILRNSTPGQMIIGIDAYRSLVQLRVLEHDENTLRMVSETNPMMQHYVWVRE